MTSSVLFNIEDVEFDQHLFAIHGDQYVTGLVVSVGPSGQVVESAEYLAGIKHGPAYTFDDANTLRSEIPYRSGVANGVAKVWDSSGKLRAEMTYRNGRPVWVRRWDESGAPVTPRANQAP
jgi:antitoxin component YwqK of YwqJK toxin-antitoxin module